LSFFNELKRRNVFRVGFAYVISAWVLLQFVDLVLDNIQAPDWVMKVFMLALVVGFPLALFFAWAFEVTPEGIKKEQDVDRSQSIANQTGRKLDRSIIVILIVAVVYFAWDNFATTTPEPEVVPQITQQTATIEHTEKSIAVLPFVNMSTDADNEFFSDGIAEEILNVLASIPDLKVAARTSAFAYKGTNTNIADIAKELGVSHVLEGSVRKSGNQVRVTAQLIKADDGFHLWSANYDRELTNIFAIQDEIADSIAEALKVSLELESGAAGNLTGTNSIEAYEHYLKGMSLWHQRTIASLTNAITEFEAAAAIDPNFAKAFAGQALTWAVIYDYLNLPSSETIPKATEAANRALSLDPESVESIAVLAHVARQEFRYADSARLFKQAINLNPSYATAYQWYGSLLGDMGDPDASLPMMRKAWVLDPRSGIIGVNMALQLIAQEQYEEGEQVANEVLSFAPEFPEVLSALFNLNIHRNDCSNAKRYLEKLAYVLGKPVTTTEVYLDLCQSEDPDLRASAVQAILAFPDVDWAEPSNPSLSYSSDLIDLFTELGEIDAAWTTLNRLKDDPSNLTWLRNHKSPNSVKLRCDPRVVDLIAQYNIPPAVYPVQCD
jgi:TolB-like protein